MLFISFNSPAGASKQLQRNFEFEYDETFKAQAIDWHFSSAVIVLADSFNFEPSKFRTEIQSAKCKNLPMSTHSWRFLLAISEQFSF